MQLRAIRDFHKDVAPLGVLVARDELLEEEEEGTEDSELGTDGGQGRLRSASGRRARTTAWSPDSRRGVDLQPPRPHTPPHQTNPHPPPPTRRAEEEGEEAEDSEGGSDELAGGLSDEFGDSIDEAADDELLGWPHQGEGAAAPGGGDDGELSGDGSDLDGSSMGSE
jgi:hypothetical protein